MEPYFWIVFLIIFSGLISFSIEIKEDSLFSPIKQHTLQDDIFLEKKLTIRFSETSICLLNFNVRRGNKTNLLKKWTRHESALSSSGDNDIKQKHPYNQEKSCHASLFSHYDNKLYVYFLRKLLL